MKNQHRKEPLITKICLQCVLPETFPGVSFDERGICNYCRSDRSREELREKKREYQKKFESLLSTRRGKFSYDGMMSYSGGKDSTFTMQLLKEKYGLNLLAYTFDNGFLPEETVSNIRRVTENLGADHLFFRPDFNLLKKVFGECSRRNIYSDVTLMRASSICTSCMALVKFSLLRLAVEKRIPFLFFGWSPGQIPIASSLVKNNPQMVRAMQKALFDPLSRVAGEGIRRFFLEEEHFERADHFPFSVSPLAFLDYDPDAMAVQLAGLGWKRPKGLDAHSSNCLLNSLANVIHRERYGFHPYVFELAKLVREGYLERSRALEKLGMKEDPATVRSVKKRLGL
jgi:tRNA(Ile)-lysidine synthase TilS/MesJ